MGNQWQKNPLTLELINSLPDNAGVGILCGIPIRNSDYALYGVDVDAEDEVIIKAMEEHLAVMAIPVFKRVGRAPRALFLLRGLPGRKKQVTPRYEKDGRVIQLEILGEGQQFVAYGVHATTKRPYTWTIKTNQPSVVAAKDIPFASEGVLQELVAKFNEIATEQGYEPLTDNDVQTMDAFRQAVAEANAKQPLALPKDKIRCYLHDYKPTPLADEYGTWLRVGMALHHQFKGGDDGLQLWNEWSSVRPKYKGLDDLAIKWSSFNRSTQEGSITFRSIVSEVQKKNDFYQMTNGAMWGIVDFTHRAFESMRYDWLCDVDGKTWYFYDGLHWRVAGLAQVREAVANAVRLSLVKSYVAAGGDLATLWQPLPPKKRGEEPSVKDTTLRLIKDFDKQEVRYCKDIITMLPAQCPSLRFDPALIDVDPKYFGVANGVIDTETGTFIEPSRLLLISKSTTVPYIPKAKCPLWEKTLKDCLIDSELVSYFKRLLGYAATGSCKEQIFIILHGTGANGKSTVLKALSYLFGHYHHVLRTNAYIGVDRTSANSPSTALAALAGCRLVEAHESSQRDVLNVSQIKQLTGGDPIAVRGLYENERIIRPTWTLFLSTNHLPVIEDDSNGIWRRVRPIPFGREFKEEEQDKDLIDKLEAELPGMLNWLIEGILEYQQKGEAVPLVIKQAAAKYRKEQDYIGDFISKCIEIKEDNVLPTGLVFEKYQRWAAEEGLSYAQRYTRRLFTNRLVQPLKEKFGLSVDYIYRNNRGYYTGIALQPDFVEKVDDIVQEEVPF